MSLRIVITGAGGLLGWHAAAHLHANNCAATFTGQPQPFEVELLDRTSFNNDQLLDAALSSADAVLHFAGVNRAEDSELRMANVEIAERLILACKRAGSSPHIVYANSTHAAFDSVYGKSKQMADECFKNYDHKYTNLIFPHIFGERAKPNYNNVTATIIDKLIRGEAPQINQDGEVCLLHAGQAVDVAINCVEKSITGTVQPNGEPMKVQSLYERLLSFHELYQENLFPDLSNQLDISLFNSYRAVTYPSGWPRQLNMHTDQRGTLFEAVKSVGGGGQSFASTTGPGITRGDHFHLNKVERFLVLQGEAKIRVRRVMSDEVWEYSVSGKQPAIVDMPTLHTHSIENVGEAPLLTLFWTNELFNPKSPDTYADRVVR